MQIAFYGDDFTGSSDALAQYHRFGLKGRLFFAVPSAERIASLDDDVIGVAGVARSMPTARMDEEVLPFLRSPLGKARVVQYKVCSTFDSSPAIGSIGHVATLAQREGFRGPFPVLPAQPHFGRYTVFANHFAVYGEQIERLDRHPTMAEHPSTPMHEADLRRVLAAQGVQNVASFDMTRLRAPDAAAYLRRTIAEGPPAIVFDALEDEDLRVLGRLILDAWPERVFALGSGGFSYAIGSSLGRGTPVEQPMDEIERLFVVSGSMAPQTAEQIAWALENGWSEFRIDPHALDLREAALDALAREALAVHRASRRGVVIYSARGPRKQKSAPVDPAELGTLLGGLLLRAFRSGDVPRAVVCGGDSSSYAARALGARSLSIARILTVAGAMCRLDADEPAVDGKLVMLKGGQVGDRRLFETVRAGAEAVVPR